MRTFTFLARKAIGCDEPANHLLVDGISIAEFGDEVEGQTVCDILAASENEIERLQDENGILRREVISVSKANEKCFAELEALKQRVWQAEHDLERCRVELELWKRRANAQLEITHTAVEIVNAPFQMYDGRIGQRGYRISTKEFEDLEKAVKQYIDAANEEQHHGTNTNEASK